jgi:aspartyl/asparaginyl beta-hydroxylase (cupin superfamily)
MTGTPPNVNARDLNKVGAAAMAALNRGDAATARRHFDEITSAGQVPPDAWLGLALSCRAMGDHPAMMAALERVLQADAQNIRALLMMGDGHASVGDKRAALRFYGVLVKLIPDVSVLPPDAAREIGRAHAAHARLSGEIFAHMQQSLAASGYAREVASSRFTQSLALLSGAARRYEQEPRSYYFPELPTVGFYDRAAFPWLDAIEAATDDIRAELRGLLATPEVFSPYIEAEEDTPVDRGHALLDSPDWTACYVWRGGAPVADIAARCPATTAAMNHAPLERVKGRAPFVLFSKLTPGARIRPHTGFFNTRLVCHLPLIVPEGCWFRVGNEVRHWQEGKAFAFNDTIEHEARNEGAGTRTVLIFNIWRPELSMEERQLVTALLESIDTL